MTQINFFRLKNSLEGLVQPFSMQVSPTEKVVVKIILQKNKFFFFA